jgi:hypothetical protein
MDNESLFIDTRAAAEAAGEMMQIANAIITLSERAKSALVSLAEYDSPHSEELKAELRRWIRIVGDPDNAGDPSTMHGRMYTSSQHLQGVADSYNV